MIYLDNAATTKVAPEVLYAMLPYYLDEFGNPGSLHGYGRRAKDAVDTARKQVAEFFCTTPDHIIFTSGGTESNNMVFRGLESSLLMSNKKHILISALEHDSVWHAAHSLRGFDVEVIYPTVGNYITARDVEKLIREDTGLVSVMYINNETGVKNEIPQIAKVCSDKNVFFHTDCVQAAGSAAVGVEYLQCDFASISSHKIHGPKGVGALYVRNTSNLAPLIYGGHEQEFSFRGGTENVAGIVGFGKACELTQQRYNPFAYTDTYSAFLESLLHGLGAKTLSDAGLNVNSWYGKILSLQVNGVNAESLVLAMDSMGVCVSAGSACRSHESKPSRTLLAIGRTEDEARSTVRISFCVDNTEDEVRKAAVIMADCISTLRGVLDD